MALPVHTKVFKFMHWLYPVEVWNCCALQNLHLTVLVWIWSAYLVGSLFRLHVV